MEWCMASPMSHSLNQIIAEIKKMYELREFAPAGVLRNKPQSIGLTH